jgi:RNA polymerase sigma factor (sigma-70 family)
VPDTILDKVAAGNPGAVEQCLARYGGLIWSIARRLSPTTSDAEDAVQEIFVDLFRNAARFDPQREPSEATFVAMVARRRLIDRHRKHARQVKTIPIDATRPMPAAIPLNGIDLRDEVGRVRELLAQLSSEERQVLELIFFRGLSQTEAGEVLNMPLGTVKTHSRRGLLRLRELSAGIVDLVRGGEE